MGSHKGYPYKLQTPGLDRHDKMFYALIVNVGNILRLAALACCC